MLAQKLLKYRNQPNVLVLALPRGGVPVGVEVARALRAPLDVFLVRKLGVPEHEELAMGAVAPGGVRVLNPSVIRDYNVTEAELNAVTQSEQRELERRQYAYRNNLPPPDIQNHIVILVDDGLATGASMRAAVQALRQYHPASIVIGVPAASPDTCAQFRDEVDEIVCAVTPYPFYGVGAWYKDFAQLSDADVQALLAEIRAS